MGHNIVLEDFSELSTRILIFIENGQRLSSPLGDFCLLQLYIKYIVFVTILPHVMCPERARRVT